jgi:hypothetical protein
MGPEGPILNALVGVSSARRQALTQLNQPIPPPKGIRALVDTGASCTCIDPAVFQSLGLTPTGVIWVHTPSTGGTPAQHQQFDVSLFIPAAGANAVPHILPTLQVTAAELAVQGIDALIGRDVLADCVLVYNGALPYFTLAF